jgi:hypothetical protein
MRLHGDKNQMVVVNLSFIRQKLNSWYSTAGAKCGVRIFCFLLAFGFMLFLYNFRPTLTYSHALARHYREIRISSGIKSAPEPLYLIQQMLQMGVRQSRVR